MSEGDFMATPKLQIIIGADISKAERELKRFSSPHQRPDQGHAEFRRVDDAHHGAAGRAGVDFLFLSGKLSYGYR